MNIGNLNHIISWIISGVDSGWFSIVTTNVHNVYAYLQLFTLNLVL